MKRLTILLLMSGFIFSTESIASKKSQWTFLIFMESSHLLHHWSFANINAMLRARPASRVRILVQLHTGDDRAWRYKIKHNHLILKDSITITHDPVVDLTSAARWAFSQHPADYHALILWDHGFGILNPTYRAYLADLGKFVWDVDPDGDAALCSSGICPINKGSSVSHRAVLFDGATKSLMNNDQMVRAFDIIHHDILHRELDLLGTDCCKMSMLEICYQLKEHIIMFIGAQNCELADGWNYEGLFNALQEDLITPKKLAQIVIETYGSYYAEKTKENTYTQSALHIAYTDDVVQVLQTICIRLLSLVDRDPSIKTILRDARSQCPGMCDSPYYIDLYTWAESIQNALNQSEKPISEFEKTELKQLLNSLQDTIARMTVACITGSAATFAHGVNIYHPQHRIDESYVATKFAAETHWLELLKQLIA